MEEKKFKHLEVIAGFSLKEVIEAANKKGITKDEIVSLLSVNDEYQLTYYR